MNICNMISNYFFNLKEEDIELELNETVEQLEDEYTKLLIEQKLEEKYILTLKQNGLLLQYVEYQTELICRIAVKQNGLALQYVKIQTEEICKLAVKQNKRALQYVKIQTEEICKAAVQKDYRALEYIKNQTEEICIFAILTDYNAFKFINLKNQTEEICNLALRNTPNLKEIEWLIKYIKDDNLREVICIRYKYLIKFN